MSDYFDRIERQIVRRVEAGVPRGSRVRVRLDLVVPALSVVVVAAIAAVFLSVHGSGAPASRARGGVELVYFGEPTAQTPLVTRAALARTIDMMRARSAAFGMAGASFQITGGYEITVRLPGFTNQARAEQGLGTTASLELYDWEANALTTSGKPVAGLLQAQDPNALAISQGSSGAGVGGPGAGSLSLYDAVKLASKQAPESAADNARAGPARYMFGAPGSAACAIAARELKSTPTPGVHCLLSGPAGNQGDLLSGLPSGVSASEGQILVVPRGIIVLQAKPSDFSHPPALTDPSAQFFVLRDHVALFGNEITNPKQSRDQAGNPDVSFGFTGRGAKAFQTATAALAHRGHLVSGLGQSLNQHFAVALDTQLITVASIDFKTYPDGLPGATGADITSSFTTQSARDLATQLRLGALPLHLQLISAKLLPAHG